MAQEGTQMFPSLEAGGDVRPYRCVTVDNGTDTPADNTGWEALLSANVIVGIADGTTYRYDSTVNAPAGVGIRMQSSNVMLGQSGAQIVAGQELMSDTEGRVIARAGTTSFGVGVALEAAGAADEIIRILWQPSGVPAV